MHFPNYFEYMKHFQAIVDDEKAYTSTKEIAEAELKTLQSQLPDLDRSKLFHYDGLLANRLSSIHSLGDEQIAQLIGYKWNREVPGERRICAMRLLRKLLEKYMYGASEIRRMAFRSWVGSADSVIWKFDYEHYEKVCATYARREWLELCETFGNKYWDGMDSEGHRIMRDT